MALEITPSLGYLWLSNGLHLLATLATLHVAVTVSVVELPVFGGITPLWFLIPALIAISISAFVSYHKAKRSCFLLWRSDRRIELGDSSTEGLELFQLCSGSSNTWLYVILVLKAQDQQKKTLIIGRDSLSRRDFKRLRLWMQVVAPIAIREDFQAPSPQ